jgi:hypothetical protein
MSSRAMTNGLDELVQAIKDAMHRHQAGDMLALESNLLRVSLRQAEELLEADRRQNGPRAPLELAERKCGEIGRLIGSQLPPGWGFALIIADFQETGGNMTYLSNCQRDGMVKLMRECAEKIERGDPER